SSMAPWGLVASSLSNARTADSVSPRCSACCADRKPAISRSRAGLIGLCGGLALLAPFVFPKTSVVREAVGARRVDGDPAPAPTRPVLLDRETGSAFPDAPP